MIQTLARTCLLAALLTSVGLHWMVVQSAAWAGMLVSFSRQDSLLEAVSKTFDGEHPCEYCMLVDAGSKKSPLPKDKAPSGKKLDWCLEQHTPITLLDLERAGEPDGWLHAMVMRRDETETPPPKTGRHHPALS